MVVLSPPLTLVVLLTLPLLLVVALRLRTTIFPATWDAQQRAGEVAGVVDEAVTGVRVVKGFGQEDRELGSPRRRRRATCSARAPRLDPAAGAVHADAAGDPGARPGRRARASAAGSPSTATSRSARSSRSRRTSCSSSRRCACSPPCIAVGQQARAGAERILDLLDANPQRRGARRRRRAARRPAARCRSTTCASATRRSEPVLDGFTLHVGAGETVALVGASGSGKSTVALLLPALLRRRGRAGSTIDGVDVRDVTLDSLRRQVGVVFEEASCSPTPCGRTSRTAVPDATDAEVEAAARRRRGRRVHHGACPRATTRSSASAGSRCRAGSASASRSPGRIITDPADPHPRRRHVVDRLRRPRRRSTPRCAR